MSEYPTNPETPDGTYTTRCLDVVLWNPDDQEWQQKNYIIADLEEGRAHLVRLRRQWDGSGRDVRFKLAHVTRITTINSLEE